VARFIPYTANRAIFEPTKNTINSLEEVIRWAEVESPRNLRRYMNEMVFMMALVNQSKARKMSFGPSDPRQQRPELAWRTPAQGIRQISGQYYLGWKVRQIKPAVWQLYNDSREAYFIEFGISQVGWGANRHVPARRIRRPVRKLSLRQTLEYMMTTQMYHRVWASVFTSSRHRHHGRGFYQIVQSPAKGSFSGPMLGRRLP
jgi:hypothetical protein